jgi:hypothetical protein
MWTKVKETVGQRFGKLVVLEIAEHKINAPIKFRCLCDCGKEKIIRGSSLRSGEIRSCGCLKGENHSHYNRSKTEEESAARQLYKEYNSTAFRRGLNFHLTFEQFFEIIKKDCHYDGTTGTISKRSTWKNSSRNFKFNGIDRIDSKKDYVVNNCVPCCKNCNFAKNTMTTEEFLSWIKKVYSYNFRKENDTIDLLIKPGEIEG